MTNKTENQTSSEWLSADRPIESRKEDVLGRRGFSEALASAIFGWSGRESLVLALFGAWGNGKSSIKNMVIECLQSMSPKVLTVDFNPWQLANRPTLSEAFFDEIGVALGKGDLGSDRQKKVMLARFRRWAHRMQGTRDLIHAISNLFGGVLIVLGAATLGATLIGSRTISLLLGGLTLFAGILSFASKVMDALVKLAEAGTEVGSKSLDEAKNEIAGDLKKLKVPILVVLDDVDRLTPQETLEVFQLIKANGDFPNLIYLLLCDRTIVETNISKILNVSGRDYLEKMVQVPFDVPMIDPERVHQVLFQRLNLILGVEGASRRFSQKRWANVFLSSLRPYFATLRDVNRFISTLAFQFSSFSAAGDAFEVNPIDLIALEVIRLREPDVYKALQSSKELLTTAKSDRATADGVTKSVQSIIERGSEIHRPELQELIKHLFPTVEWTFDGSRYAEEYGQEWYRDLRVCSAKMFDRYFRLAVSENELSQRDIENLLQNRGKREEFRSELESLHSRGLLALAVEELSVHEDKLEPSQVEPYITAIFDVADSLSDAERGMLQLPPLWRIGFLVNKAAKKLTDNSARLAALESAITNTKGLWMAVSFVALVDTSSNRDGEEQIFPQTDVLALKNTAVNKIKTAAESGGLAQHPKVAILLGLWRKWGNQQEVASYVETLTASTDGTLHLLKSLVVRSVSQGMGDYVGTERIYMRRVDIETLISMDTLAEKVRAIPTENLGEEEKLAVKAFGKAMERRSSGRSDDDPFAVD